MSTQKKQPTWPGWILEKIIARVAHILHQYPDKLTEAQKESAEIIIRGWESKQ